MRARRTRRARAVSRAISIVSPWVMGAGIVAALVLACFER